MHPLKVQQPWPTENWWVAATSAEIGREPLGRTILNQPIVLYRTESGEPVGLYGVCPHRNYPLAMSCLDGDNLRCGYHGFAFAPSGDCVEMPSQKSVSKGVGTIRRFPLVERGGLVWIWTGAEDRADPALVPDTESQGLSADWAVEWHEPVLVKCRYVLLIDNLMDLSHVSYIHSNTIAGGGAVVQVSPEIIDTERSFNFQRIGRELPTNEFFRLQFPKHDGPVDHHFDAEYFGPALIRTGGNIYAHESGELLGTQNYLHFLTPATDSSVHYRVLSTRNNSHDNIALSEAMLAANGPNGIVSSQDIRAVEAIELLFQSLPEVPREVSRRVDTGALMARHRLEKQILAEERQKGARLGPVMARPHVPRGEGGPPPR